MDKASLRAMIDEMADTFETYVDKEAEEARGEGWVEGAWECLKGIDFDVYEGRGVRAWGPPEMGDRPRRDLTLRDFSAWPKNDEGEHEPVSRATRVVITVETADGNAISCEILPEQNKSET